MFYSVTRKSHLKNYRLYKSSSQKKTVCVLLVRGDDTDGNNRFAYMAVRADKLPEFIEAQKSGSFYPEDYGIVIETGEGEPSVEVRQKMHHEYGFNHEAM